MPLQRDISHWADWPDGDLINQAAGACQSRFLLENEVVREAIALNIIAPFRQKIAKLNGDLPEREEIVKWLRSLRLEPLMPDDIADVIEGGEHLTRQALEQGSAE